MINILDLMQQEPPQMQQNPPQQPEPTEKAQIVIAFNASPAPIVVRYDSLKKAVSAYAALLKAWGTRRELGNGKAIYQLNADMFDIAVDLDMVTSIAFVDHVKRNKFIPV